MKIAKEARKAQLSYQTRRHFLRTCTTGLGAMALGNLFGNASNWLSQSSESDLGLPHFAAKAKRVIYLHMAGSPSQFELFDYKPTLNSLDGQPCPESLLKGKNFAFISGIPKMLGHQFEFKQYGESGAWVSEKLPHFSTVVDDVAFIRTMYHEEFNHAPAQLLLFSGSPRLGRPSMGSWITYGLGSENENLPSYVVLVSGGKTPSAGKSTWGSGFLPTEYQGVQCRSKGDPVLYLSDPSGMSRNLRQQSIEAINQLNRKQYEEVNDPEILARISQYEMAFRMQMAVPDAMNIAEEPEYIHQMYGTEPGQSAFANNCLLARRLSERGVRFIQLFHWGWDSHGASESEALNGGFVRRCLEVDKALTALITDLKQRGLYEDTLIVWGGEFGRTPMMENRSGVDNPFIGRDHHNETYTIWLAGGAVKNGISYGETDEIGYHAVKDRVHVHDLQATILHCLGIDHERFTYPFQGRQFRLTDVHGHVVKDLLA